MRKTRKKPVAHEFPSQMVLAVADHDAETGEAYFSHERTVQDHATCEPQLVGVYRLVSVRKVRVKQVLEQQVVARG